jgi:hypothetical protein
MAMHRTTTLTAAGLLAVLAAPAAAAGAADPPPALDPRAIAVIERTATTRATYAVYTRITLTRLNGTAEFPTAEFHRGDRHRVDTPDSRVVADCRSGAGHEWTAASGQTRPLPDAAARACGIDRTARLVWARYLGQDKGRFGKVDRIELIDASYRRTYEVTADGVIVGQTVALAAAGSTPFLVLRTTALEKVLPPGDLFSPESLATSAIPADKSTP